jgi:hypothetical protein
MAQATSPTPTHARTGALWLPRLVWIITGLGAVGAFLWCLILVPSTTRDAFPIGDGALIELYTLHASRGWWDLGPYSRFGWHHPGPLFFYLVVPFYTASQLHSVALNAGAFAINMLALGTIAWCLTRYASAALSVTVSIALASYLWRLPLLLVSAWNPHTPLLPSAALIVAAAIVSAGHLSLMPVVVAAASFVSQTHLGLLPCAVAATGCAVVAGCVSARRGNGDAAPASRSTWFWLGASALVAIVLWLPPMVQEIRTADGNLSKIARFFIVQDPTDAGIPLTETVTVWTMMMSAPARPGLSFPTGRGFPRVVSGWMTAAIVAVVMLLVVAGSWAGRSGRRVEAWCCRLCAMLSIVAFVAIARVRGGLLDHVVAWVTVIGLLAFASLAAVVTSWAGASVRSAMARASVRVRPGWIVPVVSLALLAGALGQGVVELERMRNVWSGTRSEDRTPVESLYATTHAFLSTAHVRRPLIRAAGTWDTVAGLVLQLHKRGIPVGVSDDAVWLVGAPLARDGTEDADLTVAARDSRPEVSRREGDCMLIERHGVSLHVLLSSLKEPVALTCE